VKEILTRENPAALSPEMDAMIRDAFPGLVAGDSVPPEGWHRAAPAEADDDSGMRRRRRHARVAAG
jgi:hypothetical protein